MTYYRGRAGANCAKESEAVEGVEVYELSQVMPELLEPLRLA